MSSPAIYQDIDSYLKYATDRLNQNVNDLNATIEMYQDKLKVLNQDPYDFSKNVDILNEEMTLTDVMNRDTDQKLLQQNTMYILGSITAVTLLITGILIVSK
jgi:hypothetical protein